MAAKKNVAKKVVAPVAAAPALLPKGKKVVAGVVSGAIMKVAGPTAPVETKKEKAPSRKAMKAAAKNVAAAANVETKKAPKTTKKEAGEKVGEKAEPKKRGRKPSTAYEGKKLVALMPASKSGRHQGSQRYLAIELIEKAGKKGLPTETFIEMFPTKFITWFLDNEQVAFA